MEALFLRDFLLLLGLAFLLTAISERLGIPSVLGLLLCGLIVGPAGLGLITTPEAIQLVSDIGIVLLLFVLGLEFSFRRLWQLRRIALLGGILQMGLATLLGTALWLLWIRGSPVEAFGVGMIASMSSTAVGLWLLTKHDELSTPHGRLAFSILLAQDVAVAPLVLVLRLLSLLTTQRVSTVGAILQDLLVLTAAAALLLISLKVVAHFLVRLLRLTKSREAFVLLGLTVGVGAAAISEQLGLSSALGAFLAGLFFSGFQERYRLISAVEPFRDALASLFFLSVGLLLSSLPPISIVVPLALALFAAKLLAVVVPARVLKYPLRTSLLTGVLLASVGEFSLLGLGVGAQMGLFSTSTQELFRSILLISVFATVILYQLLRQQRIGVSSPPPISDQTLSDHVLLIGYGVTGQTLHAVLKETGLPYAILELNPRTVERLRTAGEPVFLGDCTDETSLRQAGVQRARAVVVAISDTLLVPRAIGLIRSLNPTAFIAARTRYVAHIEPLYTAGASLVVAEEFEASLYLLGALLRHLGMPLERIASVCEHFRSEHYALFQKQLRGAEEPS
ncbi:MAG: cation:proton antiporter [Chlorobiota bacterium]